MADGLDNKKKIKVQKHQKSYQTKVSLTFYFINIWTQ